LDALAKGEIWMESLRGMISFVQTAREGNFARAGKLLDITAVAVSKNVSRLEQQLGVRLFARSTRKLSLTTEGELLLSRCELPLEQLELAFQASRDAKEKPSGCVRVTAVSPFTRAYLMPILGDFHALYPDVELDIELSERVTDLIAERFDVGIRVGRLRDQTFIARPLGPLKLVLCAAPHYLAKAGVPASLADLSTHKGLSLRLGGSTRIMPWFLQTPDGLIETSLAGPLVCNDFLAIAEACCAGLGIAQIPMVVALPALKAGRLKILMPTTSPDTLQLFMHYPNRKLPARVRVFVEFVTSRINHHPDLDIDPTQFAMA
jgi:DNA-binding transcriptional LysR family regulator